ncbi:hypothetical protein [Novosphingobium sp. B1]|uniref:hypothetical protein n=1 Tax=Novosphingobium sp. B1 TaxID=1938756 RepID=UPI0009D80537|nr:hypothetical protein [Novosphingobium sp. B1]SMC63423.1 hypothetical protein SAMN06272759_10548 [Novosphingobium sp. B1]
MTAKHTDHGGRKLGIPLIMGIYIAPAIFSWLILRRGFASSTQTAVFTYTIVITLLGYAKASTMG